MSEPAAGAAAGDGAAPRPGRTRLEREGVLARVVLDNPRARNALTTAMYEELATACEEVAADPSVRLVSITGAGEAFAAGTDVADLVAVRSGDDGVAYEREITRVLSAVRALDVPVLALVDGPAVGGGLAVVACCDLVYATPSARFGAPVARTLGNCVSPGTTSRLRASLGRAMTTELLLTGRLASAEEARAAGLVTGVVERAELAGVEQQVLERVQQCSPVSIAAAKELGRRLDDRAAAVEHDDVYRTVYGSEDFAEGVSAFLDRRRPVFPGR
ncbi:enoyl-CoA hydratase [uncultured Pseudokineococcus sp.]|uniref:enoyl-CoA hydratase n=1 Tax=uncultured Pseudokineococcus sp. TaxID=1642928 RepID=UPI002620A4AE|nr:enoyl-CoA hydratase [uncultured Pseudokineococcus sp.]